MRPLRIQTLQWTVGVLCAFTGMLALVSPHQFNAQSYAAFQPRLDLWGAAFVAVGAGLITVASLNRTARGPALIHASAAVVLALLAIGFARVPAWLGFVNYGLLAVGTGLAPLVGQRRSAHSMELLNLVLAISLIADAPVMLAGGGSIAVPLEPALFVLGGLGLLLIEFWPVEKPHWIQLARVPAVAALLGHLVLSNALAAHAWTAIAYYGGFGVLIAGLPVLRPLLGRVDPGSLHMRLALALAASAAAPMLLAAAIDGAREEQAVVAQSLTTEYGLARMVARELSTAQQQALPMGAALAEIMSDSTVEPGTTAYVVDAGGQWMARFEPGGGPADNIAERAAVRALASNQGGGALRAADSGRPELLSGYAPLLGPSGGVVVERPVAEVLAATWQARDARFLALLASIGVAAAGGVLVAGWLTAPLARLTHTVESFSAGGTPLSPRSGGISELTRLWNVFAELQARLAMHAAEQQRTNAEIRALNAALEQRVADRTADLQVAIANLHAQISQRTQAEVALRDSEERYRQLVEQSPEPIVVHADERFVYVNPAAVRIFGAQEAAQLIGQPAPERIHPDARAAVGRRAAAIRDGIMGHQATQAIELRIVRLDGSTLEVETTAAAVTFDGRPAIQVIVRDISERKAVERLKDEFISIVSHELRTPLTSIRGSLGLLASGVLGPLAGQGQRMLDIAVGNTDRLIRLLNDVLDLERMRFGRVTLQRSHCTAADLLGQAMSEMRGMADAAAVELVLNTASGKVDADQDRLVQVLTNLVSNAIKFSSPGVRVWLSATASGPSVRFSVRDEGRGIPPDKLETIFERFSQVDASDSREKGGTGLGLAICRTIVEAHGGRIWAESVSGQGSSFVFELPRVEWSAQAA